MNRIILLAIFIAIGFLCKAQTYNHISKNTKNKIDSTYNSLLKKHKIAGASIAIIDSGKIVYSTGYGFSDKENEIKATDETVYRIGSITKSFTALSVIQLHQNEKLDYKKTLSTYIPEFFIKNNNGVKQDIFIDNIMSHTAGLPCDIFNGFFATNPPDNDWIIEQLKYQYTIAPANFVMAYSNIGYSLLGKLIEETSGVSYEEYLNQNIFNPIEMSSSYVFFDSIKNHTLSECYMGGKLVTEPLIRDVSAGLIHSNVLDMSNYILMYLNNGKFNENQILSEELLDEMRRDQIADIQLNNGTKYGFGLFVSDFYLIEKEKNDTSSITMISHGGDTFGYHANFGYLPELGVGAVILTNTDKGVAITKITHLLKLYLENERNETIELPNVENEKIAKNDVVISDNRIKGQYESMMSLIDVKKDKKIKFKQGSATVVLKRKESDENFIVKAKVLGFISFKVRGQEINFVENGDNIYMKVFFPKAKSEEYIGMKSKPNKIPENWQNAYGKYELTGDIYKNPEKFRFQTEELNAKLYEKDGFLALKLKGQMLELINTFYFKVVDDNSAQSAGYGRNTGNTLIILPNGNLYFSGFEFKKVK